MRVPKSAATGAAATAPTTLRSVTTLPPAFVTAAVIWAAEVPLAKRTIVRPNGFGLLPAWAGVAPRSAARQTRTRPGRFTALWDVGTAEMTL
jgi:hypothetical protein